MDSQLAFGIAAATLAVPAALSIRDADWKPAALYGWAMGWCIWGALS